MGIHRIAADILCSAFIHRIAADILCSAFIHRIAADILCCFQYVRRYAVDEMKGTTNALPGSNPNLNSNLNPDLFRPALSYAV
ncbi:MAG: hypothetical protein PHO37_04325 [Kiritimatiellae bacterium]|nr:hypothetical protein [Kiritimatiellia bacterium]